jgi:hypothetical protein
MSHEYKSVCLFESHLRNWSLFFECKKINDKDRYHNVTKIELEILRANAKRLCETLDMAIEGYGNE